MLLEKKGDLDGAEAEFLKTIEVDPRHVNAHVILAGLLAMRGDLAGAEKELLRILEIDPAHANAKQFLPFVRKNTRK